MTRKKIQMKRIDNTTARHVTFSKRRKCIFKKALELSTLCEAEIALIVFRATDKLFDYASPRTVHSILRVRAAILVVLSLLLLGSKSPGKHKDLTCLDGLGDELVCCGDEAYFQLAFKVNMVWVACRMELKALDLNLPTNDGKLRYLSNEHVAQKPVVANIAY
ncbi:protein TRANSPARENT TESTA 16-like [Carya illinoinensis]|uniref:protein TRANSPARENT TESTA 16-like n=1 Tax=Carya illinoinensis TaxID=32201 RepID=UPI001C725C7F|nr:protein TRANSPARENT TESTA 16-like [Carya illinoinensis]